MQNDSARQTGLIDRLTASLTIFCLLIGTASSGLASEWDSDLDGLFIEYQMQVTRLSPDGAYVAYEKGNEILAGNPQLGYRVVHRLGEGSTYEYWGWVDNSTLFIDVERASGNNLYRAARLQLDPSSGELSVQRRNHRMNGYIQDLLPDEEGRVRFARYRTNKTGREVDWFEFDVFAKTSQAFRKANRVDLGKANLLEYVEDASGEVLAGYLYDRDEDEYVFWRRDSRGKWAPKWQLERTYQFSPVATRDNGARLLVVTDLYSPRRSLVELNTEDGSLLNIVVEDAARDVTWADIGDDGYTSSDAWLSGVPVPERQALDPQLQSALESIDLGEEQRHVALLDYSRDYDVLLVRTVRPEHPGEIHRCRIRAGGCELIGSMAPWLDEKEPPDVQRLNNLGVETAQFAPTLLRPTGTVGKLPLIVMPIDLRAQRYHPDRYDDGINALVRNGFAVLQLSYSSSDDQDITDIDEWLAGAAGRLDQQLEAVLTEFPLLDRNRVCSWATGVDAFVALDFAIRYPDRANCISAFEPITDLTLLMSDTVLRSASSVQRLVADMLPVTGLDQRELAAASVVFRHAAIEASVYLSHSGAVRGIDTEHMWRLYQMLRQRGVPMEVIEFDEDRPVESYRDRQLNRFQPFLDYLKQRSEALSNEYSARR